jgi:uncharacterized protein (DUF433 family)
VSSAGGAFFTRRVALSRNDVCSGQPTIRGTRVAARRALEFLGGRDSIEEVPEEYPSLTREDVLAWLTLSSELMKHHFSLRKVA